MFECRSSIKRIFCLHSLRLVAVRVDRLAAGWLYLLGVRGMAQAVYCWTIGYAWQRDVVLLLEHVMTSCQWFCGLLGVQCIVHHQYLHYILLAHYSSNKLANT